ncbi:SA1362 family protein [Terrilactibacillus laevilacticus]|uniref:SA1362 family protein n=1 Tax=Terrilactibacillus laevilacticus TaxID=1380157 RepID=A0ABW5PTR2_9BACI|nr:SA1362 family protein [Terrilactibacillus laevilacticus]
MKSLMYPLIFWFIIGLATIGLLVNLIYHPMALLSQLLIIVLVVFLGMILIKRLMGIGTNKTEYTAYRKAVKQSKKKQRRRSKNHFMQSKSRLQHNFRVISSDTHLKRNLNLTKAKDHGHLTVINGKKHKKRKRMLF